MTSVIVELLGYQRIFRGQDASARIVSAQALAMPEIVCKNSLVQI